MHMHMHNMHMRMCMCMHMSLNPISDFDASFFVLYLPPESKRRVKVRVGH